GDLPDRHALGGALRARRPPASRRRQLARARDALDRPRPHLRRPRRGRRADRRRRQHLRRLRLLLGTADPRARASRRARGDHRRGLEGHHLRRGHRRRGRAGRARHAADALRRHAPDDLVGHRGVDERHPAGARGDRPRQAAEVRRRLPRPRRRPAGRRRLRAGHAGHPGVAGRAGERRRQHRRGGLERSRRGAQRLRAPRVRGHPRRALSGQHGAGSPALRVPGAAARARHRDRGAPDLRRGHLGLPHRPRRSPGADRRAARPHGDGQGHRRRPARRRLRRTGRADEPDRPGRAGLPGRHAERQPARGGRRPGDARAARRRRLRAAGGDDHRAGRRPARGGGDPARPGRQHLRAAHRLLQRGARRGLRRRGSLRPRPPCRLVPRAAGARRLRAALPVRGVVPVARAHARARGAHGRGRRRGVRRGLL
ncbi:MAG: Glutamate-1-semialdehyde 2,1-aminomutase, partial [uncultured Solirubrobacteraceae bacterium]